MFFSAVVAAIRGVVTIMAPVAATARAWAL